MRDILFSLVKFDNEELFIYPSSKVRNLGGSEVSVNHKGRRYNAKLITTSDNHECLEKLMSDILHKCYKVTVVPSNKKLKIESTIARCLFESPGPSNINIEEDFQHSFKLLCDRKELETSHSDYIIMEKIHDKKNIKTSPGDIFDENDSEYEWLPDEEHEEEQWNAFYDTGKSPMVPPKVETMIAGYDGISEGTIPKIKVLSNTLVKAGASTDNSEPFEYKDNTITCETENPSPSVVGKISVSETQKKLSKKKTAKKHCCIHCSKLVINLPRHLRALHSEETDVQSAMQLSHHLLSDAKNKNSKCRSHTAFDNIRKSGDYNYNKKYSDKIICVRSSPKPAETLFVSCPLCNGYYSRKSFKNHFKSCNMRMQKMMTLENLKNIAGEARVHGHIINKNASPELTNYFFPYFTKLDQAKILFTDDTAVAYGNKLVSKYFKSNAGGKQHIYIASQLRLLADILINAKIVNPSLTVIKELIHPGRYDDIIKAIHIRCGYHNGVYKSPTTASNCCTLLLKVAKFLKCEALKNMDVHAEKQYSNFEYLLANSQNQDITRQALDNNTQLQRQKKEVLPSTAEINNLLKILDSEISQSFEEALFDFSEETYTSLEKVTLAYLLVFNRKRPGDVEKTRILEIDSMAKIDPEYLEKLNDDDKKQAEELSRYITQGKLNKKSSTLMPKNAEKTIQMLVERRCELGIQTENPYLFARVSCGSSRVAHFRADEALRNICQKHGLNYSRLNANKLRKHLATCTALLPTETQNIISEFMGHTMAVHKNVYQQKEASTDIVIMGKVLLEASGITDSAQANLSKAKRKSRDPTKHESSHDAFAKMEEASVTLEKTQEVESTPIPDLDDNLDGTSSKKKLRLMKTISRSKKTWSTPEKQEIRKYFREHLDNLNLPSIHEVQDILARCETPRNATVVRSWIRSEITRIKKNRRGIPVQRWPTPQRYKLREYFEKYFDIYKKTSERVYPSAEELDTAAKTVAEFKNKNASLIRAKIQHEFNIVDKKSESRLHSSDSESC